MSFPQRVANTLIAFAFTKVRDLYVYPKLEEILDQKFPNEKRPSLQELERNAGLALQVGVWSLGDFDELPRFPEM